jgi:DNA uptake protein ComE-like DNA-binding protein
LPSCIRSSDFVRRRVIAFAFAAAGVLLGSVAAFAVATAPAAPTRAAAPVAPVLIDINSASRQTLQSLPGIGDAEAGQIIAGRPYLSKAELVTTKVLPPGAYAMLKSSIVARQRSARPFVAKASP